MQEEKKEELIRCSVCDVYLEGDKGFTCPKCRRGPLCKSHRVARRRECASCVYEMQKKDLNDLKTQEQNLRSFLKLLQFLFIVFAIFFIAMKTGIPEVLDAPSEQYYHVRREIPRRPVRCRLCALLCYLLLHQRQKISEMEAEMNKTEFRRMIK